MSTITRHHTNARMSQIVQHGDTIYLAGQVGTAGASVAQQTQDILDQIDTLLGEVGSDKSRILQAVIWLADMADFDEMNGVYSSFFSQGRYPARTCVQSEKLFGGSLVEITCVARLRT